jgi:hypothetical protein
MEVQYFAHYDSGSGDYNGFFPTDIYPDMDTIPTPNIELTQSEWREARGGSRYRVINGVHSEVPFTTEEENEKQLISIKLERDSLLLGSDWVVLPHSPITGSELNEWITYRQSLRDISNQTPPYVLPTQPE